MVRLSIFRGSCFKEITPPRAGAPGKIDWRGVGRGWGGVGLPSRCSCARLLSPAVSRELGPDIPDEEAFGDMPADALLTSMRRWRKHAGHGLDMATTRRLFGYPRGKDQLRVKG